MTLEPQNVVPPLSPRQRAQKRAFDLAAALVGLAMFGWVIPLAAAWARRETGGSGIFRQPRIGRDGRIFTIYKIRTMRHEHRATTSVTTADDPRITRVGAWLRRWKIDELPQLVNVLRGDMSVVGPRPDVPAYLEQIRRQTPLVLSVRPGITGPASLKYRREAELLSAQPNPQAYNDRIIFPDKLQINEAYVKTYCFMTDLKCVWATLLGRDLAGATTSGPLDDARSAIAVTS